MSSSTIKYLRKSMLSLHTPLGKKRSGEQSQISRAYSQEVVRTDEIAKYYVALPLLTAKIFISTVEPLYNRHHWETRFCPLQ